MNEQAPVMIQNQQPLMDMKPSLMIMNQINHPQVIKFNHIARPYSFPQSINRISYRPQMAQMNHPYGVWPPPQQQQFRNPNPPFSKSLGPRSNWKGKKRVDQNQKKPLICGVDVINGTANSNFKNFNNNNHPTRKFFPKRKFDMNASTNYSRSAPFAPRNTTSFIIRSKKSGGIAPLVSPCPVTPAILPTPILSPSRELLVDTAKEEWGVDGYGSMKGLIRLRERDGHDDEDGSSESDLDLEEHVEVERRLDHDLSRFEMIYNPNGASANNNALENRVDEQDRHIARLEEANLDFKERLFFVERELGELRTRMMRLEGMGNGSGNESSGRVEESESPEGSKEEDFKGMEKNKDVLDMGDDGNYENDNNVTFDVEIKDDESKGKRKESIYANDVDANNVNEN